MGDRMQLIPFDQLIKWMLDEYEGEKSIFGVSRNKFYKKKTGKARKLFGETLENPLGPAAGPSTQLAQNIIASYLAGSRFFELKTSFRWIRVIEIL